MSEPNFAAIHAFLAGVMDAGYATRFADAACECEGRVFSVEVDEEVGEAWWFCRACNAAYQLRDPGADGDAEYAAVDCVCTCDEAGFEVVAGVTLYGRSETARTAYLGCRCVACGRIECYASWPRVDAPYPAFFDMMRRPQG
ncbi:hypothetical protein [Zavarzinella formosa]|uniref:hypothetical protein n=1 Tax=Zavarzinella formosa TaxID=360055 RepID=UPI00031CA893|nr:hypothetical protein [Zavarzinella formosa]